MRHIEGNPLNCGDCYFLNTHLDYDQGRKQSTVFCERMKLPIPQINGCVTGPLISIDELATMSFRDILNMQQDSPFSKVKYGREK